MTSTNALKHKITAQYFYSLMARALMIGLKVIFTFFLIHQLSASEYGLYGVFMSLLGIWISFVDLGWGDYMRREIPALDPPRQKQMLKSASTAHLLWSILLLGIFVFLWKWGIFHAIQVHIPGSGFLYGSCMVFILAGFFPMLLIYLNYSKSIEDFNRLSIFQMVLWSGSLFILYFFQPIHIGTVVWTYAFSLIATSLFFVIRHRFFFLGRILPRFLPKSLKFGFPLCVLGTGSELLQNYDRYLLGSMTSMAEVAPYHLFNNIIDVAERANQATLHPYIFEAHDGNQINRRNKLMTSLLKTRLVLQVAGIGIGGWIIFAIPHLLPSYYRTTVPLFCLIGITSLVRSSTQMLYLSLILEKKTWFLSISNALGLVISVFLNLKLIPLYHSYGAALSMLISTLVTMTFQMCFMKIWKYLDWQHFWSWDTEIGLLKEWASRSKEKWLGSKKTSQQ